MAAVDMENPEKAICAQIDAASALIDERTNERNKLQERLSMIEEDIAMANKCINRLKRAQAAIRGDDEAKTAMGQGLGQIVPGTFINGGVAAENPNRLASNRDAYRE